MEPHVYQMKRSTRVSYYVAGLACIGFGVYFGRSDFMMVLLAVPFLIGPGIYCCCLALRPRLTLTETEISVRYVFRECSAHLNDIEGWYTDSHASIFSLLLAFRSWSTDYGYYGASGDPYWVLQLRDAPGTLRISQKFAVDDVFVDFLSSLRDLNEGEMSIAPSDESHVGS